MYIESEFALLEAQNEQLTRENKRLAEALENAQSWLKNISAASDSKGYTEITINIPNLEITFREIEQALRPYQEECTCPA